MELVTGDEGKPLDPGFSGVIETRHGNGAVARTLEVKEGKAHGVYREFFDDGTPRLFEKYEAGESVGDFWPSGEVQKRSTITEASRIIEWYFPNGAIQKRMVLDRKGKLLEPLRLFFENGQLAEEIAVQDGKKRGTWLKFFEDGSPRLKAEYRADDKIVVHDAWDSDRRQTVTGGNGVYEDDGEKLDTKLGVVSTSLWSDVSELKGGVRHGVSKRYQKGVLWSVSHYREGVQHGEMTLYWDNGRVHVISEYENGAEMSSRESAKFDEPVPVVLLEVHGVEERPPRWKYPPVDREAVAQNLEEVRGQLKVPAFLLGVYERNRAGQLKSKYEDWNKFDDSIGYGLVVGEAGEVVEAKAMGSGTYSGREWNTYVPLLKQLRFCPAMRGGMAVVSRVSARVSHTFGEGRG